MLLNTRWEKNLKKCQLTFSEFTLKEFKKDKGSNWIDEIPDSKDHSIDAVRVAMMDDYCEVRQWLFSLFSPLTSYWASSSPSPSSRP